MTDNWNLASSNDTNIELLGYPCDSEYTANAVKSLLSKLNDHEHGLHLEWVSYGIEGVVIDGEDLITNFKARKKEGVVDEAETDAVIASIDSRIAWFEFLRIAQEVPMLSYREPLDGIGEGDVSNMVWEIFSGGANDIAFRKVIEVGLRALNNWRQFVLGETSFRCIAAGGRGTVLERMETVAHEYSPLELARREEDERAIAVDLLLSIAPMVKDLKDFLGSVGVDWDELMSSEG
jgi:hypothetical protein